MYGTLSTINLTIIDWNLIAGVIELFALLTAPENVVPVYGPDHESTGTGLTGCIPKGN